jgi:hypothetical protein
MKVRMIGNSLFEIKSCHEYGKDGSALMVLVGLTRGLICSGLKIT